MFCQVLCYLLTLLSCSSGIPMVFCCFFFFPPRKISISRGVLSSKVRGMYYIARLFLPFKCLHCISSILAGNKRTESYPTVLKQLLSEFDVFKISLQPDKQIGAFCKDSWRMAMGTRWGEVVTDFSAKLMEANNMMSPLWLTRMTLLGCTVFSLFSRKLDLERLPFHAIWH